MLSARARALKTNKKKSGAIEQKKKTFGFLITRHSTTRQDKMSVATHPEVKPPLLPEVASQHSRNLTATKYSILYLLYSTTTTYYCKTSSNVRKSHHSNSVHF